ncbi:MAG: hypothetical protein EHM70_15255 [Chloroflexota bacterium]|nr:MAG: hypothetical protein EHM70_15255 [Chloroflexota bacterium]
MEETQSQPNSARFKSLITPAVHTFVDGFKAQALWKNAPTGLLLWLAFILFLGLVQFSSPDLPDNDGFYHIKLAYLMRTEGLKADFPWLPLSILNQREFYDHHFLFHAALMPFTFGDLRLGAKWAAVIFASLAFLSVWNLLKNQRVPFAWLWAFGLVAVSEAFIYRMSITRAQSLSLAVLVVALDWLLQKKYTRLAFLAGVYVWLYDAFPLLFIFAGIYVFVSWPFERRLDLRPLLYVGIGTGVGLVANPYFPHNIVFAYLHILPKLFDTTSVGVGNEWYPYETAQLLKNSPLALAAFISGALALGISGKRMDLRTAISFCLACLFGLMLFQSRRFIEYFPAFALVFAAFAWTPVIHSLSGSFKRKSLPAIALALALIPGVWITFDNARSSLQSSKPYETYAGASAWLVANTPAGARVFQTDWDDFPRLFYYNTHNTYLIGLDPTYLLIYDAGLYHSWVEITQGKTEQPSGPIEQEFGARYVLTDLRHQGFLDQAEKDPGLVEVYRDKDSVIYQVSSTDR